MVLICKIGIKYQNSSRAVCSFANIFQKQQGRALIGTSVLIRTKTVFVHTHKPLMQNTFSMSEETMMVVCLTFVLDND